MIKVVTALILNPENNKFLIVKRKHSESIHSSLWAFPGGRVEKDEDIIEALKREVKEETNLDVKNDFKQLSGFEYVRPDKEITVGFCFSCTSLNRDVIISDELDDFKWIKPGEFLNYKHIPGLEKEVKKAFSG
ncbi:NUDIX hydrolase [Candidatus Woesearchaeota archaeon]|nr:NUDIX hydrolase [Candidatus Woesearchaeota archaeon]